MENNTTHSYELIKILLKALTEKEVTSFYNEPIFLTLLSILLGGIALTFITKHVEQRIKRREMAIEFINEIGLMLSLMHAKINGYIKRKDYGKEMDKEIGELKGELFSQRFSVRVKSKAYLQNNEFWKNYDLLIYEIDIILYIMKSAQSDNLSEFINIINERCELLTKYSKITEQQINEHKSLFKKGKLKPTTINDDYSKDSNIFHEELTKLADMIWLRSSTLISVSLENTI